MAKLVSEIYGEALFGIAMEEDKGTALLKEVEVIRKALQDNPEFDNLMLHPGVPKQEKIEVIGRIFDGRVSDEMTGFLKLVVQKERYRDLSSIFQYFADKVKEAQKIGIAYVTTAIELSKDQQTQVQKRILETTDFRSLEMYYQVDPDILGGMIIRIGDRVVDSSIRTKLDDLTRQLLQIQLG